MTNEARKLIEDECRKLSIDYARYVDFRRDDLFVQLLAPDGELNTTGRPIKGRDKLAKAMAGRPQGLRSRHVLTNIHIDVIDENHAEGISYLTLYRHEGIDQTKDDEDEPREISGPAAVGHYSDRFIRTDEGWRFSSRVLKLAFRVKKNI